MRRWPKYFLRTKTPQVANMKPALRLAHILFGREIYKVDASRKFDINKDATYICRKTTCTHRNFSVSMVLKRIIFHWSHMVTLFIRDMGRAICVLVFPILQSENKNLPPKLFWGKALWSYLWKLWFWEVKKRYVWWKNAFFEVQKRIFEV